MPHERGVQLMVTVERASIVTRPSSGKAGSSSGPARNQAGLGVQAVDASVDAFKAWIPVQPVVDRRLRDWAAKSSLHEASDLVSVKPCGMILQDLLDDPKDLALWRPQGGGRKRKQFTHGVGESKTVKDAPAVLAIRWVY